MFQQKMELDVENLHSIKMYFNKSRNVSFKLKSQINIDELVDKENFTFDRSYMQGNEIKTDTISWSTAASTAAVVEKR